MTSLHVAAKKGESLDIVEYLIKKGANINVTDYNGVRLCILLTNLCSSFIYFAVHKVFTILQADESYLILLSEIYIYIYIFISLKFILGIQANTSM